MTKILIDTMKHFKETDLLNKFLKKIEINVPISDFQNPRFDKFKFFESDELDEKNRREIDGIIELDSALIFIESKKAPNKFDRTQLLKEFKIGNKISKKRKINFYLLAIDEHIDEPSIIGTIRRSAREGVKREQIKWISWHEITKIMQQIFETHDFDGKTSKRIFEDRLNQYKEQGFKSFEGFNRNDIIAVSKVDDFLQALILIKGEIRNFIKGIQIELKNEEIIRLYQPTIKRRGKRVKVELKEPRLYWECNSVGIGRKTSTIAKSYTFPFADVKWKYLLKKKDLDYYMYIRFDFITKEVIVGYFIKKMKNIRTALKKDSTINKWIKKNKTFNHKPLMIDYSKIKEEIRASELIINPDLIDELRRSTMIKFTFKYDILDKDLLNKVLNTVIHIRDMVKALNLLPEIEKSTKIESLSIDEIIEDEYNT